MKNRRDSLDCLTKCMITSKNTTSRRKARLQLSLQQATSIQATNTAAHRSWQGLLQHQKRVIPTLYKRAHVAQPLPEPIFLGRLGDKVCPHCQALLFSFETTTCFRNGKVLLHPL